jgi:predicted alpha/beta superfamily hydrolase
LIVLRFSSILALANISTRKLDCMHTATIIFCLKLLLPLICFEADVGHLHNSAQLETPASSNLQVVIQDTERHELASSFVNDTFKIHIYYPRGYDEMTNPIPVVYLLDAEYSFGAIAYTIRRLIKDKLIPPVLLVGVAYEVSYDEYYQRRERDFTPTKAHLNEFPYAGYGKSFGRFLRQELVPFINRPCRVIPEDRTIIGLSFSGLFLAYLLFNEPHLFNRYIIVSPSLWWDNAIIFQYESGYREKSTQLQARVYLAAGEDDGPWILRDLKRIDKVLSERHYQRLAYRVKLYPEETHRTVFPIAVSHGLRFVFSEDN